MRELLIPADPETAIVEALRLDPEPPIATRLPRAPLPALFGRVVSAGGTKQSLVHDRFTVTLEGFGQTERAARDLCARMIGVTEAHALTGYLSTFICYDAQTLALPSNDPLPTLPSHYRYSATITVDLRRLDG